jgi:hypothetical protein
MRFPLCVACGSRDDLQRHHLVARVAWAVLNLKARRTPTR